MKVLKIFALTIVGLLVAVALLSYEGDIPKDVVDARYSSPASQYLDLGARGRIHYRDEGHRRDLPIILLHGSSSSLHTWEGWVNRLSNSYRLISIDLPGHGLTGEVPSRDYSQAAYMEVVAAVAEELELKQFVIGGNSMGGGTAWQFTLEHPEQVLALILVNSVGASRFFTDEDSNAGSPVLVFDLLRKPWFRVIARNLDPYPLTVQGLQAAYGEVIPPSDAVIQRYYDLNLREGTRNATIDRFGRSWIENYEVTNIKIPTLILWGELDALIPVSIAERWHESLDRSELIIYEKVGHMPMEEIPDRSARDVDAFLSHALQEQ